MTPLQEKAVDNARALLTEHFDSWVMTYKVKNENLKCKIEHDFHGDITDIVGLVAITQSRLLEITSMKKGKNE